MAIPDRPAEHQRRVDPDNYVAPVSVELDLRSTVFKVQRVEDYRRPLRDARDLIASYGAIRASGAAPRPALARASIVMTMSGWQAYVQVLAETLLVAVEPAKPGPGEPETDRRAYERDLRYWRLRRGEVMGSIAIFSTPNAENSRNLLLRVGFDPWPVWEVTDGRQKLSAAQTRARLNEWLQVRHALAHGGSLPDVSVLDRTRSGATMLTRRCAERCNRFVGSLIISTEQHLHPRSLLDPGEYL